MAMAIRTRFPGGLLWRSDLTSVHSTSVGRIQPLSLRTLESGVQQPSVPTILAQAPFCLTRAFTTSLRVDKEGPIVHVTQSADKERLFWTEEEDRIIKNLCLKADVSLEEIQRNHLPHRTLNAIRGRRRVLAPPKKNAKTRLGQWTEKEDQLLQRLYFEEGWSVAHIYHRFPWKTTGAITYRCSRFKAIQGSPRKVNWSEEEHARLMEFIRQNNRSQAIQAFPHRDYLNISSRYNRYREEWLQGPASDEDGQGTTTDASASASVKLSGRRRLIKPMTLDGEQSDQSGHDHWTPEEDATLMKCAEDSPKGLNRYWAVISERLKEEPGWSKTLVGNAAYNRHRFLTAKNSCKSGRWDEVDVWKLEAAVQEQIGTGYKPFIDVAKNDSVKAKTQNGDGLRYLKVRSKELQSIKWVKVAEKVGTRTSAGCRKRFYMYNTNSATGRWSQEETKKLVKGYEKFGNDVDAISGFVGTRGPEHVRMKLNSMVRPVI